MTPDVLNTEQSSDSAGDVVTACTGLSERVAGADQRSSSDDASHTTSHTENNVADTSHCKTDESQTVTSNDGNY